ncbi:hypothetical protein LCGC14_2140690 [marine sediment metagenome]|uniref:Uncharacterized protein n=1 Tax=marine sediment metagenome TaxID=412755 RepID=A0A0F9DYF6_9ZZZZ
MRKFDLSDRKECPECKEMFERPIKANGCRMSDNEWFRRTYCSNICRKKGIRKKRE